MQLVPRYLVSNKTVVVVDDFVGKPVEYRKVYQRNLKVTKGIDNVITFEIKNSDQKPISILGTYTPYVEIFTEDKILLKKYIGTIKETSTPNYKGQFTITITDNDLLNYDAQYMSYTVYLNKNSDQTNTITYADEQFGISGTIEITGNAFPGPIDSISIDTFNNNISSVADAQPNINGNDALHTAAIYTTNYNGDVVIEGTLGPNNTTSWFTIDTVAISSASQPVYQNFNGVFSFIRFKLSPSNSNNGTVDKILLRN